MKFGFLNKLNFKVFEFVKTCETFKSCKRFSIVRLMLMCELQDEQERDGDSLTVTSACHVDKGSLVLASLCQVDTN